MTRIFESHTILLVGALLQLKRLLAERENEATPTQFTTHLMRGSQREHRSEQEQRFYAEMISENHDRVIDAEVTLDVLIDGLIHSLEHPPEETGDLTLIDRMEAVLCQPWLRNRLGPGTIKQLKDLLVYPSNDPDEVERVINHKEWTCGHCHRDIEHGEALSVISTMDGQRVLVCANCQDPYLVACSEQDRTTNGLRNCNRKARLERSVRAMPCQHHQDLAAEAERRRSLPAEGQVEAASNVAELLGIAQAPMVAPEVARAEPNPFRRGDGGAVRAGAGGVANAEAAIWQQIRADRARRANAPANRPGPARTRPRFLERRG